MENKAERKRIKKFILYIMFAVIILLSLVFLLKGCSFIGEKNESPDGLIYESQINDESPLSGQYKIIFPGFSKKTVRYRDGQKLSLQNPSGNMVDFIYEIEFDGKQIYKSSRLSPGEIEKWDVRKEFNKPGTYEVKIIITPFDKSNNPKNGFEQTFKFEIV